MATTNHMQAKLVLLGDMGAGKSSLALRFVKGQFFEYQESTIGAAFLTQTLAVNGEVFEIWDTAGQERYHSRGAAAAIIVYDITNAESFARAKKWVQELQRQGNANLVMALAGSKADLAEKRTIETQEGQAYAEETGLFFMETSAKNSQNVNEIFYEIARKFPKVAARNLPKAPSFSESEATSYISSLKERLSNCLHCSEVDVQRHAKNVVEDTIAAAKVLSIQSVRELILECPSKLSLKYRRSEDSSAQKAQEFVLQIKLRLELLAAQLPDFEVETRNKFIEDIASLMEEVQFSLPGDIFDEKEGLLEFTNRVVKSGYEKVIPEEVQQIYKVMELSGFDETDIVLPQIVERTSPNSAGPTKNPIMARSYFAGKQQRLRVTVKPKPWRRSRLNGRGPESDPSMCEFVPDTPMQLDTPAAQGQRPSSAVSDHERPLKKRLRYASND